MRKIDLNDFRVATSETARDINRRLVLNLIRKHQPISRADLSRRSRLQRSTVSAITEELIGDRWVTTGAFGDLPRGRKPMFLHLNGNRAGVIGIDIRPAATTIALANLEMRFLSQESLPTGSQAGQFIAELCRRVRRLMDSCAGVSVEGIGVALPGRVDLPSNRLCFAPNMGWGPVDFKAPLEAATGVPVELENAANACALAEIWSGIQLENVRNLVAVTVAEGIGVGMILNRQLVRGSTGLAGEFGHVTIEEDGPLCKCGNRGCLEVCASNTAAVRYFTEAARKEGAELTTQPDFEFVLRRAEAGDAMARGALSRMARSLGMGIAMLVAGLAPDVIVVIGEVTRAWKQLEPVIHKVVSQRLPTKAATRVLPAATGAELRLRGALALVLQKHFWALADV